MPVALGGCVRGKEPVFDVRAFEPSPDRDSARDSSRRREDATLIERMKKAVFCPARPGRALIWANTAYYFIAARMCTTDRLAIR